MEAEGTDGRGIFVIRILRLRRGRSFLCGDLRITIPGVVVCDLRVWSLINRICFGFRHSDFGRRRVIFDLCDSA